MKSRSRPRAYVYVRVYICMHACMHVWICMYAYCDTYVCACVSMYVFRLSNARTHARTHARTDGQMRTDTHTQTKLSAAESRPSTRDDRAWRPWRTATGSCATNRNNSRRKRAPLSLPRPTPSQAQVRGTQAGREAGASPVLRRFCCRRRFCLVRRGLGWRRRERVHGEAMAPGEDRWCARVLVAKDMCS